jgi:ABC-type lipoprotein export system ATPase subunit
MKIKELSKVYKTKYEMVHALGEINLCLPEKGLVFIVGVSGSGKTTLMNMLSGVDVPSTGEVIIGDKSLYKGTKKEMFGYRNSYVGLVFQDYNLIEDLNVYDNIKLPFELLGETDTKAVDEVIKKVDIEDIKYSRVNEISSGQMQRVAIARALIKNSSMILADEPTGNLDTKNEKIILDLLKEISRERLVVVITHGDEAAIAYGDRIIEIEDGQVVSDTNPLTEVREKTPTFIDPVITFSQQVKFTKGFIHSNLGRSLSIFLVLLLIPMIGGILSGYVFYDVGVGYGNYQDKYNSNYVSFSQSKGDYDLYYTSDQYSKMEAKYEGSTLIEKYDTSININMHNYAADYFYKPTISNIIIYKKVFDIVGIEPFEENEILITDYLYESLKYYQDVDDVTELMIDGMKYDVVGYVKTDYQKFKNINFVKSDYRRMAFEENLEVYNAIFTSPLGYLNISTNMRTFIESVSYVVYSGKSMPETKFDDIVVHKYYVPRLEYGKADNAGEQTMVSTALLKRLELTKEQVTANAGQIFLSFSKSKYQISIRISGVYESDELGLIVSDQAFNKYTGKQVYSRALITRDDVNYKKIVNNENITNPSFVHAKNMWDKAKGSKIVMVEVLIVLIIIVIAFSSIINSMTAVTEKKKIGIKYSFGLKKISIVLPYALETVFYIIIGFFISTIVVKWGFISFMKNIIYSKEADVMAFDFFYISWTTVVGWDLSIYLIMLVSLAVMILKICRKSPIEIIKDL